MDPSGLCWIIEDDGDGQWYPDTDSRCINQFSSDVKPASSYGGEGVSQYIYHVRGTYHNLCGHISSEIVLEAILGGEYDIHDLVNKLDKWGCDKGVCGDSGTSYEDLGRLLAGILKERASVSTYTDSQIDTYETDANGAVRLFDRNIQKLKRSWKVNQYGQSILLEQMKVMLMQGSYLIVGGILNTTNGRMEDHVEHHDPKGTSWVGHWVVIKSIYGDTVNIINPYMNSRQSYSWSKEFQGSMSHAGWLIRVDPR
jgi:hypothetical protein